MTVILLRALTTAWWCLAAATTVAVQLAILPARARGSGGRARVVASVLRQLAERLGPSYIKIGQILSTRRDLFGSLVIAELARLQDRIAPLRFAVVPALFQRELGIRMDAAFREFDSTPMASGSIASIYKARLLDGCVVAVKVRRPESVRLIRADLRLLRPLVRLAARLPPFRLLPLLETFEQVGACLERQLDFHREAEANRRLRAAFADDPAVLIPSIVDRLCSASIITMAYLPGFGEPQRRNPEALSVAVRALFRMIFVEGFVHCDMHQGNIRLLDDGRVALVDFGFMADVPERARHAFADFFLAVAHNDGKACARITLDVASAVPPHFTYDLFEREVVTIVKEVSGATAGAFEVAGFVVRMFDVQRRFGVRGTAAFTIAILSLLVLEGIVKDVSPHLDFQRDALPYILRAQVQAGRRYAMASA